MRIDLFRSFSLGDYLPVEGLQYNPKYEAFASEAKAVIIHLSRKEENKNKVVNNSNCQDTAKIVVYVNNQLGKLNRFVFGNNLLGHWLKRSPHVQNANYGAGIWDGKWDEPCYDVVNLAIGAGVSVLRFPGGCGTHSYNWKEAVGKKRKAFWFGIDEFLKVCSLVGAEPVITVSFFTGDEEDAADLVEYLNALDDGSNPNDGVDWAHIRATSGHPAPYNVNFFEIGNEVWHGNHKDIKQVTASEYAERYLRYYKAMKAVDGSVKIGVILHSLDWDKAVINQIGKKFDFVVMHIYPYGGREKDVAGKEPDEIFKKMFFKVKQQEWNIETTHNLINDLIGEDRPIAVTEFNGWFVQDRPVPYRHCLGTALINADLLRIFMKPENNILMANYWNFVNEYWGMVANGFKGNYRDLYRPYYKRPNYFVFELYHKHFGDVLVASDVDCGGYDVTGYGQFVSNLLLKNGKFEVVSGNLVEGKRWQIWDFEGVSAVEAEGILKIDFIKPHGFNYYHSRMSVKVKPDTYYRLSGYIKTEHLVDDRGVCLEVQDGRGWDKTHSAVSTKKVKGESDWVYVEAIYKTLPDAKDVSIIARRIGEKGPLKGKAFFKGVRFEELTPLVDTKIPYLSVNASKSRDNSKVFIMVVNRNLEDEVKAEVEVKGVEGIAGVKAWVLNGPSVDATNEGRMRVKVREVDVGGVEGNRFYMSFEPHSVTAVEARFR